MMEQRMAGDLQRRLRQNHDFLKKSSNGLTKYKTGSKLAADFKSNCYDSTFAPNYLALTTDEIRALCVNKCVKNSVLDTALSTAISLHMPLEMERINKHLP